MRALLNTDMRAVVGGKYVYAAIAISVPATNAIGINTEFFISVFWSSSNDVIFTQPNILTIIIYIYININFWVYKLI
ncbi:hypothetical protein CUN85_05480 [Methanolobus halotolerans]|uniref:Uncharacterized protein n=1 Tax=Methanolobus halotolerans TaxID=2052935 RepID=A0A4E0PWG2_9EURY|nr:hypothetical protein CUN85_05480 [Methanolobus halotolerans]